MLFFQTIFFGFQFHFWWSCYLFETCHRHTCRSSWFFFVFSMIDPRPTACLQFSRLDILWCIVVAMVDWELLLGSFWANLILKKRIFLLIFFGRESGCWRPFWNKLPINFFIQFHISFIVILDNRCTGCMGYDVRRKSRSRDA